MRAKLRSADSRESTPDESGDDEDENALQSNKQRASDSWRDDNSKYWRDYRRNHNTTTSKKRSRSKTRAKASSVQHDTSNHSDQEYEDPTQTHSNPAPPRLNHYVHVFITTGKSKQHREFRQLLHCASDPDSIEAALTLLLVKEGIEDPLDCFKFGVKCSKSEPAQTIYKFNLNATNLSQLNWSKVYEFTLTQFRANPNPSTPTSFTIKSNTEYLSHETEKQHEAEQVLQDMFKQDVAGYNRLRGQTKIYLQAKRDLMLGKDEDDVRTYIYNALHKPTESRRPQNMLLEQQQQTQNTLQNLMQMMLLQTMGGMGATGLIAGGQYGGVHGPTHHAAETRFDPMSTLRSILRSTDILNQQTEQREVEQDNEDDSNYIL